MTSDSTAAQAAIPAATVGETSAQHADPTSLGPTAKVEGGDGAGEAGSSCSAPRATKPAPFRPSNRSQEKGSDTAEAEEGSAPATREERGRGAPALDWTESKLPGLFGCHNTAAIATSAPIPLHTGWDLYVDDHSSVGAAAAAGSPTGTMSADPVFVAAVADVQSFWRLWRYVTPPSSCRIPFTYSWFRHDIRPEWEHPRNKKGGTIVMIIFDRDRPGLNSKAALDDVFMAALLGSIGESFAESSNTLNGIMLKLRQNKPVTLQLWTAHSEVGKLKTFTNSVRDTLGKIIGTKPLQKLEYFSHHQNQAASNSLAARMKGKAKATPDHVF